jgi:hypothetical protein
LIVFGGLYDITWELDDLFLFDIKKLEWVMVDDDSSRRKENNTSRVKENSPTRIVRR